MSCFTLLFLFQLADFPMRFFHFLLQDLNSSPSEATTTSSLATCPNTPAGKWIGSMAETCAGNTAWIWCLWRPKRRTTWSSDSSSKVRAEWVLIKPSSTSQSRYNRLYRKVNFALRVAAQSFARSQPCTKTTKSYISQIATSVGWVDGNNARIKTVCSGRLWRLEGLEIACTLKNEDVDDEVIDNEWNLLWMTMHWWTKFIYKARRLCFWLKEYHSCTLKSCHFL